MEAKSKGQLTQYYDDLVRREGEGLLILDPEGRVTAANRAAVVYLDCEQEVLIGQHWRCFWPPDFPPPEDLTPGEPYDAEMTACPGNGRPEAVKITVNPVAANGSTNLLVAISTTRDVRRLNDSLSHAQRLVGIGTLAASIAHEINTPLSIITATTTNLRQDMNDGKLNEGQLARYVEMIEQSAWRCARIVSVLRNYSLDDVPEFAVADLNMVIEDALALVQHQFQVESGVEIEADLQHDLKSVVCDPNRMTQVLVNLLTNARDAMQPAGGTIQIRSWLVTAVPEDSLFVSGNGAAAAGQVAFSVRDSGHGIAPEMMEQIFAPFYTTKTNGHGTGLGLFIARRIVAQHHGRIWAENNPDGGATFTVVLPRTR
ncbi:MAG: nitrogen regulation protein NR(II) [Anaerolineae bacterium]